MRFDTLKRLLVESEEEDVPRNQADRVWNFDPERLKLLPMARLMGMYNERAKEFDQPVEEFTDVDLLIAKMSSEYSL